MLPVNVWHTAAGEDDYMEGADGGGDSVRNLKQRGFTVSAWLHAQSVLSFTSSAGHRAKRKWKQRCWMTDVFFDSEGQSPVLVLLQTLTADNTGDVRCHGPRGLLGLLQTFGVESRPRWAVVVVYIRFNSFLGNCLHLLTYWKGSMFHGNTLSRWEPACFEGGEVLKSSKTN